MVLFEIVDIVNLLMVIVEGV